jgi:hypothetical protein
MKITYGIQIKQGFRWGNSQVQGFWLEKVSSRFITPFLNPQNG